MKKIQINEKTIDAIWNFITLDDKDEIIARIDRVIELAIKSKIAEEYQMSEDLGTLFDVKLLINGLPFTESA